MLIRVWRWRITLLIIFIRVLLEMPNSFTASTCDCHKGRKGDCPRYTVIYDSHYMNGSYIIRLAQSRYQCRILLVVTRSLVVSSLSQVRELSVELLLLYEHTLSLHNSPEEAFLPTTIIDCSRSKTPTNNKPTPPQLPQAASLLQLRHFPRLAKLISAKHEDPEQLGQSPSESFIPGAGGGGRCIAIRKMRPKSAGASSTSSRKHFASSASVSMLNRTGPSPSTKQRHDRMGGCNTTGEERLIASGTLRPMSAPGRRRPANNVGREEVAIGRIFHGETCTGTHELSRKGLIGLVEKLRERLRRLEGGHNRRCREVSWLKTGGR